MISSVVWVMAGLFCMLPAIAAEPAVAQEAVSVKPVSGAVDLAAVETLESLAATIESDQGRAELLRDIRALIALQKQR